MQGRLWLEGWPEGKELGDMGLLRATAILLNAGGGSWNLRGW